MSGIYLEPEATFSVSVVHKGGAQFEVVDGAEVVLSTLTGREHHKAARAIREQNGDLLYTVVEDHLISGIDPKKVGALHPNVVMLLAFEIMKRSHLTEIDAGN